MDTPVLCSKCHNEAPSGAAFCPFCGTAVELCAADLEARAELKRIDDEKDPVKKHKLIEAALAARPDSLELLTEKLHLGRLYERGRRGVDFSVIKCYLLHIYRAPEELAPDARDEMRRELFGDPLLKRCRELASDAGAFTQKYLARLASEYVQIFLCGDSRVMRSIMGFRLDTNPAKRLAPPVAGMIARVGADKALTSDERDMLISALRAAYAREGDGGTRLLDEALQKE